MVINFNINGGNGGGGTAELNSVIANIYVTDELVADTGVETNFILAGDGVDYNIWGNSDKPVVAALYAHGGLFEESPAVIPVMLTGNYAEDPDQLFINFTYKEAVYYFKIAVTGKKTGTMKYTSSNILVTSYNINLVSFNVQSTLPTDTSTTVAFQYYGAGDSADLRIFGQLATNNAISLYVRAGFGENLTTNFAVNTIGVFGQSDHLYISFICDGYIYYYELVNYAYTEGQLKFDHREAIANSLISYRANIYNLTDINLERETAIYNEMESASTWSTTDFTYYYNGDGQFQLRYTDGTLINLTSFVWSNQPARWVFNGEFTDKLGQQYKVEYYLYGDETSSPYVKYTAVNNVDSSDVKNIKVLTAAEYTALTNKDSKTLYCIKG